MAEPWSVAARQIVLFTLWLPISCFDRSPAEQAHNVVLITLDTVRADHLGCYGYPLPTLPHIDRLAAEGARFESCIATAAVTPVSHASLFTGLYPAKHGLRVMYAKSHFQLRQDVPTMAEVFAGEGWRTAAFTSAFPVSELYGFKRGFDHFDNGLGAKASDSIQEDEEGAATWDLERFQQRSDVTTDKALAWLSKSEEPFFLWLHYWDPHDIKVQPPPQFAERFAAMTSVPLTTPQAFYDAEIAYVDEQIGRLCEELRSRGLYERTLFVVTADHGQGLGEHGWFHHRLLYQEQIHLPLILRGPGVPRAAVKELVRGIDVFPTVLELCGLAPPQPIEGASLLGLMQGRGEAAPRTAYAEQLNRYDTNAAMLRQRPDADLLHVWIEYPWKLIFRPLSPEGSELYNLERDPEEAHNLHSSEPARAKRLRAALERQGAFVSEGFGAASGDSEVEDALRALGYMDDKDE